MTATLSRLAPGRRFFRHREWELYRFGLRMGWHNLRAGGLRRLGLQKTLGKLLQPVLSPTRFAEYDAVLRHLPLDRGLILDVGSPKLFDLWLASRYPVDILATDVWPLPAGEYAPAWSRFTASGRVPGRVRFVATDGTRTCFPPASFDCIFAISVIEHIDDDGDRRFLDEAARLLVPGGQLVITVPFATHYREEYVDRPVYGGPRSTPSPTSNPVFFQRIYDRDAAECRLLRHEHLAVLEVKTLALRMAELMQLWSRMPARLRGIAGFLNPFLSGAAPRAVIKGFPGPGRAPLVGDLLVSYERKD